MTWNMEQIRQTLKAKEYKLTPQRQAILGAVKSSANHPSAEDIFLTVKKQHPDLGLATVYRTLDLLSELDILQKIDFGDGKCRYELNRGDEHHHHHLMCMECGRVWEFADDLLDELESVITSKTHFQVTDHQLKVFGYCEECQQRRGR